VAGCALYVVHVSCHESVEPIALAREKGWNVFGETCTQYFFVDYTFLEKPNFEGAKYVYTPPPRDKANQEILWAAVRNDVLSAISDDHCAFLWDGQKTLGKDDFSKIPNGGPGLENRLHMIHEFGVRQGRIGLNGWSSSSPRTPRSSSASTREGHDRRRLDAGHRRLRPDEEAHDHGRLAALEDGLQPLRGTEVTALRRQCSCAATCSSKAGSSCRARDRAVRQAGSLRGATHRGRGRGLTKEADLATPERRYGPGAGITLGGIIVIVGILILLFWSVILGIIVIVLGLTRLRWVRSRPLVLNSTASRR
jgi:hypothetical protein